MHVYEQNGTPRAECQAVADEANLLALYAGVFERQLDAGGHSKAISARICHVVRIACDAAAKVLCQDVGAASLQSSVSIVTICSVAQHAKALCCVSCIPLHYVTAG